MQETKPINRHSRVSILKFPVRTPPSAILNLRFISYEYSDRLKNYRSHLISPPLLILKLIMEKLLLERGLLCWFPWESRPTFFTSTPPSAELRLFSNVAPAVGGDKPFFPILDPFVGHLRHSRRFSQCKWWRIWYESSTFASSGPVLLSWTNGQILLCDA